MQYYVSFLVLQSSCWGRDSWLLDFFVFLMSCVCYCSLSVPHSAVDWSAVCDCVISWPYSLNFCKLIRVLDPNISDRWKTDLEASCIELFPVFKC